MKGELKLERQTNTVVDQLVELMRARILLGELKPGEPVSEPGLAAEFGISRAPAREALIKLEEQGLIRKTYAGREVARTTPEELKEFFEIKTALEGFVVYKLAGKLSSAQLKVLERIIGRMKKYSLSSEVERFGEASSEFHDQIIQTYGNKKIVELYQDVTRKIRWTTTTIALRIPGRPQLTVKEHQGILEALIEGDADKARSTFTKHSASSMERILQALVVEIRRKSPHKTAESWALSE